MAKSKINALVLDYGAVISQPQDSARVDAILEIVGRDRSVFHEAYIAHRDDYDRGRISGENYWSRVLESLGVHRDESDIRRLLEEDVKSWTIMNEEMIAFITENRENIHELAIISNMTVDTLAYLQANCRWLSLFDTLTFSCELGVIKPDPAIYESCLEGLAAAPDECLFVDDSADNVRGAVKAGMRAVQFTSQNEFMLEWEKRYVF